MIQYQYALCSIRAYHQLITCSYTLKEAAIQVCDEPYLPCEDIANGEGSVWGIWPAPNSRMVAGWWSQLPVLCSDGNRCDCNIL